MDSTGYVGPGEHPRLPVEWTRFGPILPQRITSVTATAPDLLVELNATGWDTFGARFAATGLAASDQVIVTIESPEGFVYQGVTMTCGSLGDVANGATIVPIDVQSDRYLIRAYLVTAAGTTSTDVQTIGYMKAGCRERF